MLQLQTYRLQTLLMFLVLTALSVNLPWTTPGPIGIIMGTGFGLWSFVLALTLIVVDVLIYYPFLKAL